MFFLCLNKLNAQDYRKGRVVKILTTNSLLIQRDKELDSVVFVINDTKSLNKSDKLFNKGIKYLNQVVLNKEVYFDTFTKKGKKFIGSIIYNCKANDGKYLSNELPCLSANFLDAELINKKFVIYTGSNEYLKPKNKK